MRIVNKKKFARFIAIVIAMVLCIGFIANGQPKVVDQYIYNVGCGDTLWTIAEEVQSSQDCDIDVRDIIYDIQRLSDCGSDLYVGQVLYIPIYE
jgi:hypothetical protein